MPRISLFSWWTISIALNCLHSAHATSAPATHHDCALVLDQAGLAAHSAADGLIQFKVAGVAHFQGRVISRDSEALGLQGQLGSPRRILLKDIKDLRLMRDERGHVVTRFTPVRGLEISRALRAKERTRGSFEDAVMFALEAHGPQVYNDVHYGFHLDAVVSVLTRFGISDSIARIAAILHDVIEDAHVSYGEVTERFGSQVADAVRAVSLPSGVPRAEAFELLYPAIRDTPYALWVKLADRIANVEDARRTAALGRPRHFASYAGEWDHFKASLSAGADPTAVRMFDHLQMLFSKPTH